MNVYVNFCYISLKRVLIDQEDMSGFFFLIHIFCQHKWFLSQYGDLNSIIIEKNQMTYLLTNNNNKKIPAPRYIVSAGSRIQKLCSTLCFVQKG